MRRQLRVLVAAAVLGAVVGAAGCSGSSSPSPHATSSASPHTSSTASGPAAAPLAQFSGNGNETTKKFSAAANWEISWHAGAGAGFTVELIDSHGASRGNIVTAGKKTSGATFVSLAGTFRLKVTAKGSWSIKIVGRHK